MKRAPAPAQSGFNLHGPRCQINLTTPSILHPSISHLARCACTPSPWVHSHIVVSPEPAANSQYMLLPAISYQPPVTTKTPRGTVTKLCFSPRSRNSSYWLERRKQPHTLVARYKSKVYKGSPVLRSSRSMGLLIMNTPDHCFVYFCFLEPIFRD